MSYSDDDSDCDTDDETPSTSTSSTATTTVPVPAAAFKPAVKVSYKPRAELSKLAYTVHGFFLASYNKTSGTLTSTSDNHLVTETLLKVLELTTVTEFEKVYDHHFDKYAFLRHILELGDVGVGRLVLARHKLLTPIKKMCKSNRVTNGKQFKLASISVPLLMLMVNHCKGKASRREFYRLCWTSYYTSNLADVDDLNQLLDAGKAAGFHIYWDDFTHFIFKSVCDDNEDYLPTRFRKPRPDKVAAKFNKDGVEYSKYVDETNYSEPHDGESDSDNDFYDGNLFYNSSKFQACVGHIGDIGRIDAGKTEKDEDDEKRKIRKVSEPANLVCTQVPPSSKEYVRPWFLARARELKEIEQMSFCDSWEFQSSVKTYVTANPTSLLSSLTSGHSGNSNGSIKSTPTTISIPEKIDWIIDDFKKKVPAINSMLCKNYTSLWTKTQIRQNVLRCDELKNDLCNTSPYVIKQYVRAALLSNFVFDLPTPTLVKKKSNEHTVKFSTDQSSQPLTSSSKFLKANPRSCPQMLLAMDTGRIYKYSSVRQESSPSVSVKGLLIYEIEKFPSCPVAILTSLAVEKNQRNGGLGKLLMTMFLLVLKNLGVKWCVIEAVYAAQNFYQRFGFQDFRCYSPLRKLVDAQNLQGQQIDQICRNNDHNFVINLDELEEADLLLHLTQDDLPVSHSLQSKKRKFFSETADGKWYLSCAARSNPFSSLSSSASLLSSSLPAGLLSESRCKLPDDLKAEIKKNLEKNTLPQQRKYWADKLLVQTTQNAHIFSNQQLLLELLANNFHPSFLS